MHYWYPCTHQANRQLQPKCVGGYRACQKKQNQQLVVLNGPSSTFSTAQNFFTWPKNKNPLGSNPGHLKFVLADLKIMFPITDALVGQVLCSNLPTGAEVSTKRIFLLGHLKNILYSERI